jgi:hypothetical protein
MTLPKGYRPIWGDGQMRHESSQAKVMDFAEIWHGAQHRRTDEIASDINNLKTVAVFSGIGLLVSLVLASDGWDLGSGFFSCPSSPVN